MIAQKIMSPLAWRTYSLLLKQPLSAKQISTKLKLPRTQVYVPLRELISLGIIVTSATYPKVYRSVAAKDSAPILTSALSESFTTSFGTSTQHGIAPSFIFTREQMMQNTTRDMARAKYSVEMIMSGHEVPAETNLRTLEALKRGVRVRMLMQKRDGQSRMRYANLKKMGMEIKITPQTDFRVMIVDNHIVYFCSYSETDYTKAVGVRFDYAPYAKLMLDMFEQKWHSGDAVMLKK